MNTNFGGRVARRTVADMPDDELGEALHADLRLLRRLERESRGAIELDEGGLLAAPLDVKARHLQHLLPEVRQMNNATTRVLAMREEQRRRGVAEQAAKAAKVAQARQLLEALLAGAPAAAAAHVAHGGEVLAALERLRAIARDLELATSARKLWQQHAWLCRAVADGAAVLERPAPDLPSMPDEPEAAALRYLVATLADGNVLDVAPLPSDAGASRAAAAVKTLRKAAE